MDQEEKDALHREMIARVSERVRDAAPGLLEALIDFIDNVEDDRVLALCLRGTIKKARAAIEKATGSEHKPVYEL